MIEVCVKNPSVWLVKLMAEEIEEYTIIVTSGYWFRSTQQVFFE